MERRFSAVRALTILKRIHESDRRSTTPAYAETAEFAARTMRRFGLKDVEKIPFRADGRSRLFDWRPSPAWRAMSCHPRSAYT